MLYGALQIVVLLLLLLLNVGRRPSKRPLVFGAKTDREMREWMMAIKLLAEKLTSDDRVRTTPVTAPAGGIITRPGGVAMRRVSDQSQQHLLQVSRRERDNITRRSSPQLQTITDSGWSVGQFHASGMHVALRVVTVKTWSLWTVIHVLGVGGDVIGLSTVLATA